MDLPQVGLARVVLVINNLLIDGLLRSPSWCHVPKQLYTQKKNRVQFGFFFWQATLRDLETVLLDHKASGVLLLFALSEMVHGSQVWCATVDTTIAVVKLRSLLCKKKSPVSWL